MGSVVGIEENFSTWSIWEEEYSRRGFRTISLDAFENANYNEKNIKHLLGIKRAPEEKPVIHSALQKI